MILRASDRALADMWERNNLRAEHLWTELDRCQNEILAILTHNGEPGTYDRFALAQAHRTEREILAQLERVDY